MRQSEHHLAPGDRRQDLRLLGFGAGIGNDPGAEYDGCEERFQHETAPENLHQHRGLHRAATEAVMVLGDRHGEPAQLGELFPMGSAEAVVAGRQFAARLEAVFVLHEAQDALLQHRLFVGQYGGHGR